ncbi:hypothetical protein Tco_1522531 [Tanacetum coccineum]
MSSYHQTYSCELCGNDFHYGYDCPQNSPSFQQQYLCCENCGGPHAAFQCQPMNQNLYNSSGLDQFQPPQYSVVHQPPQETNMEMLQARENLMEAIRDFLKKYDQIPSEEKCIALLRAEEKFLKVKQALEEEQNQPEIIQESLLQLIHDLQLLNEIQPKQAEEKGINKQVQKKQEEKSIAELLAEEQAARINALFQNHDPPQSFICQDDDNDDDDYDKESIISMNADMTLIMEDEDIDTIPEKESGKDNESSAENIVQNPSESEATFDNESECDLPIFDDSPLDVFEDNCVIFSRPLFDSYGDSTSSEYSSDNESFLEEDVFSNLPFEFDIKSISSDVNPIYDEIDPLLEEFAGELALINPIPPGIAGADSDPKGDIRHVEKLLNDNSSHRTLDELNSEDIIEFFSTFPIPVEDSDSLLEETNTILSYLDDSLPELETFSFDVEENNSGSTTTHTTHTDISLPKYDSFHFDLSDTSLHLADKSDSVFEKFDDELAHIIPPLEEEPRVHIPNVLPTLPTLYLDLDFTLSTDFSGSDLVVSFPSRNRNKTFDLRISIEAQSNKSLSLNKFSISFISDPFSLVLETLLPFSSKIEDKVFNPGILVSKEEKSPHLLSHRALKLSRSFIISLMKAR